MFYSFLPIGSRIAEEWNDIKLVTDATFKIPFIVIRLYMKKQFKCLVVLSVKRASIEKKLR